MEHNKKQKLQNIEVDSLCDCIYKHYGYDYRDYARSSLTRRINKQMDQHGLKTVSALQDRVLHDSQMMEEFILNLSINVTSMFRDPDMYLVFRRQVVPMLKTYPSIRIWLAGCSSGEEAYSIAILLEEEGLGSKSTIYATDINEAVIKKAKAGIISQDVMQEYSRNYIKSGGTGSLSDYYTAKYGYAKIRPEIIKKIVFSKHNLAIDGSFNEFNVILCRNVMIYFNEKLQTRVQNLIFDSLCRFGVLILGSKETIQFTSQQDSYRALNEDCKVYQRHS